MTKPLAESLTLKEATRSSDAETGLLEVEFISAGWGSSGYYSDQVVEAAAPLFAEGTHMYFDHPTAEEEQSRPGRSVRDLAAVIAETGTYDATAKAIRGKVRPLKAYAELLTDEAFAKNVGLSIRGSATDIVIGEAEGRKGPIIEGLADVGSVDFVTKAGRGGRVLQVLESAGVVEATVNDTREALLTVLRDAYQAKDTWIWVRDFDETTVWFEIEGTGAGDAAGIYGQSYTQSEAGAVELTGDRTEVRVSTTYVPVARPGSTTTTESQPEETQMGTIQIEETEHKVLVEKAGRVETLESERDTEKDRADQAEAKLAEADRREAARKIIGEAEVDFDDLQTKGLMTDLPVKEGSTDLDAEKFKTTVDEQAAKVKAARGAGSVRGFGGTTQTLGEDDSPSVAEIDNAVAGAFGRQVKEA